MVRNLLGLTLIMSAPILAGPPLICHSIDIGTAKSLPWIQTSNWQGADPSYDLSRLADDTLALLTPATPITGRMETLRRPVLHNSKDARLADELTSRLLARALDSEAAGKQDPNAWFDAGYLVETLRQASFVYRHDMLTPSEKAGWKLRTDK